MNVQFKGPRIGASTKVPREWSLRRVELYLMGAQVAFLRPALGQARRHELRHSHLQSSTFVRSIKLVLGGIVLLDLQFERVDR